MESQVPDRSLLEDLVASDAVERLHDLVEATRICLFTTMNATEGTGARPMHVQEVDPLGSLWFFSERSSGKNVAIENDRRVQLYFANSERAEFMVVLGDAHVHVDRTRMKELRPSVLPAWFAGGSEEPMLSLIEVRPTCIQYWMPEHGMLVSMIKTLWASVSHAPIKLGKQGTLSVRGSQRNEHHVHAN